MSTVREEAEACFARFWSRVKVTEEEREEILEKIVEVFSDDDLRRQCEEILAERERRKKA